MSIKEKVNTFFDKLPFKGMAEKIPTETRAKAPVLNKVIPFANQIACGLVVVLLVTAIVACSKKNSDGGSSGSSKSENEASGGGSAKATNNSKAVVAPASDFKYDLTANSKGIVIVEYTGNGGNIIVPDEIEGMPVIRLAVDEGVGKWKGFRNTKVTGVVLPDTIVFRPSIMSEYNPGFENTPLQSITLPKGATIIPGEFFKNCKSLKSIDIPATVKVIEDSAFEGSGLTEIVIPEGVTTIGFYAFRNNKNLKSLTLPESIRTIEPSAFTGCSSLETVKLPSHKISYESGFDVFDGCTKLSIAARKAINDSGYSGKFTD